MLRFILATLACLVPLTAQQPDGELFEKKIRPVLATKCYACHSAKLKSPMGGLVLDTKSGLTKGGANGAIVVPGKPAESRLLKALRYDDPHLQMPPSSKLSDQVVADFAQWIAEGANDPRKDAAAPAASAPLKGMDVETGRKWWAFQPVRELPAPAVRDRTWPKSKIDFFLLAKLEQSGLQPSAAADRRLLIRRAYLDLVGLAPTYYEVEAFAKDPSPGAFDALIEKLLASSHYGERWGRHWLDTARYGEDNSTSEATNPAYTYAWRYRDWVIEALNKDLPYDRFVKLQLAADLMPDATRSDMRALGYLGAAPVYHKEPRLSKDVLETFAMDDWDERVDAVSRGLLGLTVACARCHDHKFDPIPTKDYYGLAGVFASTMRAERPMREDLDASTETRFLFIKQRLFDLDNITKILANEKQTNPEAAAKKVVTMRAEMAALIAEMEPLKERYPEIYAQVARFAPGSPRPTGAEATAQRRRAGSSQEPFINAVYEAALYVDGSDPGMTQMRYKPGEPRNLPVFRQGNVTSPGEITPRHFLTVLAKDDGTFRNGSGRLELGERIFSDSPSLAARVIVNRVWDWHFGKPLVATPSDFGTQGDLPSHPELLDDLAARFIAHNWSLKWLHREIMRSAAYQQRSNPRPEAEPKDQSNRLLWRMNPRRVDVEVLRDTALQASSALNLDLYGPSLDFDAPDNNRRTVYARVSRGRLNPVMRLYDFPDAMQTSPGRDLTITPLQQLFVMNSEFIEQRSAELASLVDGESGPAAKVKALYRRILARNPQPAELDLALSYLEKGTVAEYAQALLATNEVVFWP
ncbi:MAG: PSD1 and planctomycete cytochrome C domain-containing protein [Acidobacteriota bacterium]